MSDTINDTNVANLISAIFNAEEPESITNEMVARILGYLREHLNVTFAKANANESTINTLLGANASQAIENFNEVLAFLDGIKDNESLTALLSGLNEADKSLAKKIDVIEDSLPDKLDNTDREEIEQQISDIDTDLQSLSGKLYAFESNLGIFPFHGTTNNVGSISTQIPVGSILFLTQPKYFVKVTENGPSATLPHNTLNDDCVVSGVRDNAIFRNGNKFYYFNGSVLVEYDSRIITTVMQRVNKLLYDLEQRQGTYGFHGIVQKTNDITNITVGTVWFVRDKKCFYLLEESGMSPFIGHNDSNADWMTARQGDAIYSCDGDLFIFNGDDLESWEPWLLRDDLDYLLLEFDDISSAVDQLKNDVKIYAFDGISPAASGVIHRPIGSIVYANNQGYFVKNTESGPSPIIPHNIINDVGGCEGVNTDALFRCGSTLYRHDGTALVAVTGDIEVVKTALFDSMWASIGGTKLASGSYRMGATGKELTIEEAMVRYERNGFIKLWNAACANRFVTSPYYKPSGQYNESTGYFELNGITDIGIEEAIRIYSAYVSGRTTTGYRTNIPVGMQNYQDAAAEIRMFTNTQVEKICGSFSAVNAEVLNTNTLKEINAIRIGYGSNSINIQSTSLEIIYFSAQNAYHYSCTIRIPNAANFRLDGIAQIVKWVSNSTVTVHRDVYAKLTGDTTNAAAAALSEEELAQWQEMAVSAAEYNITFATT